MSSGMPELGSKISLISKADIRYEGRLFTVDPQECTIALASVRSFGTEDRETQYPVPAQSQVYDYILFRGSDIKDIRVINVPTLPNDPAIMQLSVPPSLGQQPFPNQGFSHPVVGAMGPPLSHFNTNYMTGLAPGMVIGGNQMGRTVGNKQSTSVLDLIGGGSRSATPASINSRKSPTADQAVQVNASNKKDDKRVQRPIKPPIGTPREHSDFNPRGRSDFNPRGENMQNTIQAMEQHTRNYNYQGQGPRNAQSSFVPRQHQWGPLSRGQTRARGRRPIPLQGAVTGYTYNRQMPPPTQSTSAKPKSTLKFENDYDFEEANTQFEELRTQLEKVKIKDNKPEVNGENEKKDDSGNETGAGEGEPEEEDQIYYDKAKSFFDNISCEAVERSKGRSQRTDWRTERKLNSETFGVSSTRRGFRGGRGGYYRGGYRPNYRGGYRPQTNQNNHRQNFSQNRDLAQEPTAAANPQPTTPATVSNGSTNKQPN